MLNCVVDLSHHNGTVNLQKAKDAGIFGVIHKATQGARYTDRCYVKNREAARKAGINWGAYHFGVGGDGAEQAEHFLDFVRPDQYTLLALDFEPNPTGPSMTLTEAHAFVSTIHDATGKWPGFYSGHYIKEMLGSKKDGVLSNCWLWLAQYGPRAIVPPTWQYWTMWQYTDGNVGEAPHSVTGIGPCDRDKFNGTQEQLERLWGLAP